MSKKKDTEIEVIDTKTGVQVKSGKKKLLLTLTKKMAVLSSLLPGKELAVTRNLRMPWKKQSKPIIWPNFILYLKG